MKNLKLNGLNVIDYGGENTPIVFVHAYPLCNRMWDEQVEYFKSKFRVITYDVRGLGYSFDPENIQFTMEEHVNDLFFLLDRLKIDRTIACGISLGGYILQRAMLKDQKRFSAVILADTKSEGENNDSILSRSDTIIKLKSGKKDIVLDELLKNIVSNENYNNEKLRIRIREIMGWMDERGIIAVLLSIISRTCTTFQLKDIETPVLIIAGKEDVLTPPVRSYYMKENLSKAEMKIIKGAGHLSNMENPDEFNLCVNEFIEKLKHEL